MLLAPNAKDFTSVPSRVMRWKRGLSWAAAGLASAYVVAQPIRPAVVVGVSMEPTYPSGEILWTKPIDRPLRRGDVVLADTPSGTVIKRIAMLAGDCRLQLNTGGRWNDLTSLAIPAGSPVYKRTRLLPIPAGQYFSSATTLCTPPIPVNSGRSP